MRRNTVKRSLTVMCLSNAQGSTGRTKDSKGSKNGIIVKGIDDVSVRFSKCCSPVPGDEIVGFVTRGRGISIHRTDCVNVINMSDMDKSRLIEAEWQRMDNVDAAEKYMADIKIFANNRTGLIVDVSKVFTEKKIERIKHELQNQQAGNCHNREGI